MNTMQYEFDAVVAHLYKQGKPARNGNICQYRTKEEDGTVLMCAVGCRIPDAKYVPEMDATNGIFGTGVFTLLQHFRGVLPDEIAKYSSMFSELQGVHDARDHEGGAWNYDELERALKQVAEDFDLTFTVPEYD